MKQVIPLFFLSMLVLLTSVFSMAQEGASNEPVIETGQIDAGVVVPLKEDVGAGASEEVHIAPSKEQVVHKFIDERILAVESDAQEKILAIVEQINLLTDKSDEAELQKEIKKIKLDAEIARLGIQMETAEDGGDFDLARKIQEELYHLATLDEPVVGFLEEQPAPSHKEAK